MECLERITKTNKENAAQYEIVNLQTGETFIKNFKESLELIGCSKFPNRKKMIWKITKIKKQSKTIFLLVNDNWIEFNSYEKCDKFLNKWRGYTSTKMLRDAQEIDGYKVKIE